MAIVYGLFAFIGMFANIVILYVLIDEHRSNKRKPASSSFVLSLCIADTFQLSSLPFKIDGRLFWGCCHDWIDNNITDNTKQIIFKIGKFKTITYGP